ncbi:hypothetical protein FQN50_006049 [Emmonsiellopsis sp. PD_5]|nr:hypothetical protein FQN50_006049 [Emmonsiellopsis sp. PD_5]
METNNSKDLHEEISELLELTTRPKFSLMSAKILDLWKAYIPIFEHDEIDRQKAVDAYDSVVHNWDSFKPCNENEETFKRITSKPHDSLWWSDREFLREHEAIQRRAMEALLRIIKSVLTRVTDEDPFMAAMVEIGAPHWKEIDPSRVKGKDSKGEEGQENSLVKEDSGRKEGQDNGHGKRN